MTFKETNDRQGARHTYSTSIPTPPTGELPPPTTAPSSPVDDDPHSPLQGFAIGE